jgi:hypothetical protein
MKRVLVLAMAFVFASAVAVAQEPVKKAQEPKKVDHKCKGECKGHKKDGAEAKAHNCGSKDANHKCKGECKDHKQVKSVKK